MRKLFTRVVFRHTKGIVYKGKLIEFSNIITSIQMGEDDGEYYESTDMVINPKVCDIKINGYGLIDVIFFFDTKQLIKNKRISRYKLIKALDKLIEG